MIERRCPATSRCPVVLFGLSRTLGHEVKYLFLSNARGTMPVAMETERELKDRFDAVRERADALRRHL